MKDFGSVHQTGIKSIAVTSDSQYLFTSDSEGNLKQWSAKDYNRLVKVNDYGTSHEFGIGCITETTDSQFLFTSDSGGVLKQWDVQKQNLVKDFGKIHDLKINCIIVSA